MLKVEDIFDEITEFRHQLHRIPEIAGKEFKTRDAIREYISGLPLEVLPPFLETDTVAFLRGGKGAGPNVTLRADIDALPLPEQVAQFSIRWTLTSLSQPKAASSKVRSRRTATFSPRWGAF